ncbi:MAG TPA: VWA domain-containing protein [Rhizobiaceae bacterium]|nr:VWA domain-containing protein [Rhizobiaceae bacterium]
MTGDFHFLRPWWLLALVAALALVWLAARQSDLRSRWRGIIAPHLLDHLLVDRQSGRRPRPPHFIALAIALGAIGAAGPTWERERPPFVEDKAPLALVIDLSQGMDAIDITPTRLERVKLKVQDLMRLRPGARTAVFAYAGSAHMVLPLTEDAGLVQTYVSSLETRIMPVKGKDTAKALQLVDVSLAHEDVPGTILFMTDGVEQAAFEAFKNHAGNKEIMVLGVGTPEGGPVKTGEGEFLTDATGGRVIERLDVEGLQALGKDAGVRVATITLDDSDVRWIAQRTRTHLENRLAEGTTRWRDVGWWFTIPVALLGAFWFRRGWSVHWAGLALAAAVFSAPIRADAVEFDLAGMWLTPDQQGRLAFEKGDYKRAAALFADPMWRGVAYYRAGSFGEAIDAFAQVRSPDSYFNQGNALAHLDKLDEAVASYKEALTLRPGWRKAKDNLAIVEKLVADRKKEEEQQQEEGPNLKPDAVQFDKKGEKGTAGQIELGQQTAEMWMRNIQVTPTDLLARKFAIEAQEPGQ